MNQPHSGSLIIYDGLCGFCDRSVRWVIRRDRRDRFRFAPQQSTLAGAVLARHLVDREALLADNSVYLALDYDSPRERLLARSDVTVNILLRLGGGWPVAGRLLQAVPKFLRDRAYTLVARNRFRIGARYKTCPLPSAAERAKFLG